MAESLLPSSLAEYLATPTEAEHQFRRLYHTNEPVVICDIGACEGEDSIRYARIFPRARIFAFEPLPANQAIIRTNLLRYDIRNVELIPLALSDRAGAATFHVSSGRPKVEFAGKEWNYGNKSSSLLPPSAKDPMYGWVEFKENITVRTETLDNFCRARGLERIDFIHMDVQGAERLVLAGASAILSCIGALWLEVSDQPLYTGQMLRPEIEAFMHANRFALGSEVRREIEGDQFYVNKRLTRVWPYLAGRRAAALWSPVRSALGLAKRTLLD